MYRSAFALVLSSLFSINSTHAALTQPYTFEQIQSWITSENITSIEAFISKLPEEHLQNYTLMHHSKSLHGSSYQSPRAILFGNEGQWVVAFNGDSSQAAGKKIEMMIYDPNAHTYGFHELDFSKDKPVFRVNPQSCTSCHGVPLRPIWDHYNRWDGAYGEKDDKFSTTELTEMAKFIAQAPSHPRYQYLQDLKKNYSFEHEGVVYGGYTIDRHFASANRQLSMRLSELRYRDITHQISRHPQFTQLKPVLFYFLARCYKDPATKYEGDGQNYVDADVRPLIEDLIAGRDSNARYPSKMFPPIDYIFSRLGVNTSEWFINSRALDTYRIMDEGSDKNTQSMTARLLEYAPEYAEHFALSEFSDPIYTMPQADPREGACARFTREARVSIQALKEPLLTSLPALPTLPRIETLPALCLKCHAQQATAGKVLLPIQELSDRVRNGDRILAERLRDYITPGDDGEAFMPRRTPGDQADFDNYMKNDYPVLKQFIDQLLDAKPTLQAQGS